jgi:membrane protein DedA with SNARE-associated domain
MGLGSTRLIELASVTERLVNFCVTVVGDLGLGGVFLLMAIGAACIPIPSEAVMLFAGFNVSNGHYSLFAAVTVGVLGVMVGSWVAYGLGYAGRVEWFEKHGRRVGVRTHHLQWADSWFQRHGDATVFWLRMVPLVRAFISLPAGIARMPFWRFTLLTVLGSIPFVFVLTFIGKQAGSDWEKWKNHLQVLDYLVVAVIVIGAVWLVVRSRRRRTAAPV